MKTALQELIEIIENKRESSGFYKSSLKSIHTEALMLLQKEQEQIEDAYFDASDMPSIYKASAYYDRNYKN
jgi:hypothetical protein